MPFLKKIVLLLFLATYTCSAQTTYFNRTFGFPDPIADICPSPSIEVPGEGYIFIYSSWNFTFGNTSLIINKIDLKGDTLWTKKINKPGTGYGYWGQYLAPTSDGNYIIAANFNDYTVNPTGKTICVLMKITTSGDTLWSKGYTTGDLQCLPHMVKETSDKGFVLVGFSQPFDTSKNALPAQIYLIKTDSAGNKEWEKQYGGILNEDGYAIVQTPDKGYLITGYTTSYGAGDQDIYLIKTDSLGKQQWQQTYGTMYAEAASHILQLSDGNYLLAGGVNYDYPGRNNGQGWLIKIKPDGTLIWEKKYGGPEMTYFYMINELANGFIVAAGGSNNTATLDQGAWLLKANANGDSLWSRIYDPNPSVSDIFYGIISTSDKGYLLTGSMYNSSPPVNSQQAWLLKVDSMGCDNVGCQFVGINTTESGSLNIEVFPNPATDFIHIEVRDDLSFKEWMISIADISGKIVLEKNITNFNSQDKINITELSEGLYFLSLYSKGQHRGTIKIVKTTTY